MKIFNFSFFLILFHFISVLSLNAGLTLEEQELILKHEPPVELKEKLDQFFLQVKQEITKNPDAFSENLQIIDLFKSFGCRILNDPYTRGNLVFEHKDFKNYIIKMAMECSINGYDQNVSRVRVADKIRESIDRHKFKDFIVPKKYLYHFPVNSGEDFTDDNYCVVSKKLNLQNMRDSRFIFDNLPEEKLDELLTIIEEAELGDVKLDNIQFTCSGDLAFIDTEDITEEYSRGCGVYSKLSQEDFEAYIESFKRDVIIEKDSQYAQKIEQLARSVSRRNRDIARKIARKTIVRVRGFGLLKDRVSRNTIEGRQKRKLFRRYAARSKQQIDELIEQSKQPLLEYTFGSIGQPPVSFNDFS